MYSKVRELSILGQNLKCYKVKYFQTMGVAMCELIILSVITTLVMLCV
jgi:hypothetical protein